MTFLAALLALAQPALPQRSFSPLLFVRFEGPGKVSFYQGRAAATSFPAPVAVGMRPGYYYRVRLGDIPRRPGLVLFPTLEVHGSLLLPPRLAAPSFPVSLKLSDDDLDRIEAGAMISKVFYLEHPDKAEPRPTRANDLIETDVPPTGDMIREARRRGRVVLVMHVGPRAPTYAEVAAVSVPGTILYPGQRVVGPAAAPPPLRLATREFFDPRLGPRPAEEECLHDGGDRGEWAGLDGSGKLYGVGPEDSVAEWTDSRGRRHVVPSNRVCLCVPRFLALRQVIALGLAEGTAGPLGTRSVRRQGLMDARQRLDNAIRNDQLHGYETRVRPAADTNVTGLGFLRQLKVLDAHQISLGLAERLWTTKALTLTKREHLVLARQLQVVKEFSTRSRTAGTEQVTGTSVLARVKGGPQVVESKLSVRDLNVCCGQAPVVLIDRPLTLMKTCNKESARPGEEITFTLKYTNQGQRPLTDVAVTDSLSGRLEYVAGSSESDRAAVFTTQDNEAGSSMLRWEITGSLQPGESGRVRFKARVR